MSPIPGIVVDAEETDDPIMRQILSDSQQNPKALMDHMKNPMVSSSSDHVFKLTPIRSLRRFRS